MRLGDDIDDYCTRCKRSTDHSIAAVVGDEVQKVACRICHTEHPFRHNDSGKPTKEQALEKRLANAKERKDRLAASAAGAADSTGDADSTDAAPESGQTADPTETATDSTETADATEPTEADAEVAVTATGPTGAVTKKKRARK